MSDTNDITLPVKPKKKTGKLGLFGPLVFVLVLFAVWSGYWFYIANRVQARVLAHQKSLINAGYQASFEPIRVEGYPYRMFLDFRNVTIVAPSGKGFSAPSLQAEANAYALTKWVMTAPEGLTVYRGRVNVKGEGVVDLGKVVIAGRSLKASVSGIDKPIYTVALQGLDLTLTPSDILHPFAFSKAELFEAYLRPNAAGVADSADMLIRVNGAYGEPKSIVGDLSPGQALSLHVETTIGHMSGFKGEDFTGSLNAWRLSGGQLTAYKAKLTAGDLNLFTTSDALALDETSHVKGKLNVEMSGTFNPIDVLGALHIISPENMTLARPLLNLTLATQGTQKFAVDFHDGGAWVGPLKVSDAPILP